jgi:phage terminase Nu1 subunit (DNA packaging protein)
VRNQRSFFIPIFKKEVIFMSDKKSLDQLRLEKERAELRLAQEQRRLTRLENRKQYYEKGERAKRTHELCNIGGIVESLAPMFKGMPKQEMYELMEAIFSLLEVQRTLHSFMSRKEDAGHGDLPLHSRPD